MLKLIDGKELSREIRNELKETVSKMSVKPCLAVILVGDDPASVSYVKGKEKACNEIGIISRTIKLPPTITKPELITIIQRLDDDSSVSGILVQLPLPDHINKDDVLDEIFPEKDVDGFTIYNAGEMYLGRKNDHFIPCTPLGTIKLIEKCGLNLEGKSVTVIGRSDIVGKPIVNLLASRKYNATVMWANSKTGRYDLERMCNQSDCLIVACGKHGVIDYHWIPPFCTVIDVGVNRIDDNTNEKGFRLVGDVYDKENNEMMEYFHKNVISITPVPGGVGPMTIAMLMSNVVEAAGRIES